MIEEILRERIAGGENEWTEFKRDFFSESDVLPAIVALANGAFEGWIIFGVTEEGEIEGVPDSVSLQDRLTTLCQQRCEPALPARVETVKTGSGTVVVLRIHGDEAAKPYRSKRDDTSWIRKGVQTEIVTPAEAEQFVEEQYRVFAPTLRQFCVEGFRSLYAAQLRLKPLNIIIGPNASGKSNLFKALRLVRDVAGEGIDKSYQEMGRHLFWYGDPGRKDTRFMLDMTVAVPGQQGRFAPRYWLGVKLAKDRLGIEEESLTLRLRPAESEVAFIERQGGKIQHYVERISSGASLEEPEHVSVQGKLPLRTAALATYGREATFTPLENLYRFIQGWRFLQVDPCAARASVIPEGTVEEIPALQDNGGNLSAFLYAQHRRSWISSNR